MPRVAPTLFQRFLAGILCTCLGLSAAKAAAQPESPQGGGAPCGSSEPKRGTGKIVGGIMAISGGVALGGLMLLMSATDCHDDEACQNRQDNWFLYSLGAIGAGTAIGVPLIVSGARDRKAWKRWKTGLVPVRGGGAATLAIDL